MEVDVVLVVVMAGVHFEGGRADDGGELKLWVQRRRREL